MKNLAISFIENAEEELPKQNKKIRAKTKGYYFHIWDSEWVLDKNSTINLSFFHKNLDKHTLNSFVHVLAYYASNLSASHT